METRGSEDLPIDVELIARDFGVSRIEPRKMNADGYLGKAADGNLVIRYKHDACRERARFTIAHEIGHLILARAQGADVTDPAFRVTGSNSAEEAAVNRIAAELLMPERLLRDSLQSRHSSWDLLRKTRGRFLVSTTALVLRILELPGLLSVFLRMGTPRSKEGFHLRCRTSEKPQILFSQCINKEAERILADAEKDVPTPLRVFFGDSETIIPMASRFTWSQGQMECWSIGWRVLD